jgi:hypothetical protein
VSRIFVVVPLAVALADDQTRTWLADVGVPLPAFDAVANRVPTPEELRAAVEALPGVRVEYQRSAERWYAHEAPGTPPDSYFGEVSIELAGPPEHFGFRNGIEEVHRRIVAAVTPACGPQVYISAAGDDPVVIA